MFYFVVRYLRWLARVPGLAHFFDAVLLMVTCVFRRSRLAAMERLEFEALRLAGVSLKVHHFGGIEFVQKEGRELGHLHGHGLLDVAVGRHVASVLLAHARVRRHHVFPRSKWVSFQIQSKEDVSFALQLLKVAQSR
jgi:hypothetical protein